VWIKHIGYYNENLIAYSVEDVIVRQNFLTDAEVLICDLDDRYLFTAVASDFGDGGGIHAKPLKRSNARASA
jgi:hypothetical protein